MCPNSEGNIVWVHRFYHLVRLKTIQSPVCLGSDWIPVWRQRKLNEYAVKWKQNKIELINFMHSRNAIVLIQQNISCIKFADDNDNEIHTRRKKKKNQKKNVRFFFQINYTFFASWMGVCGKLKLNAVQYFSISFSKLIVL